MSVVKSRHDALLVGMFTAAAEPIVNPPASRVPEAGDALLVVACSPPLWGDLTAGVTSAAPRLSEVRQETELARAEI